MIYGLHTFHIPPWFKKRCVVYVNYLLDIFLFLKGNYYVNVEAGGVIEA